MKTSCILLFFLGISFLTITIACEEQKKTVEKTTATGSDISKINVEDQNGKRIDLASFKGKTVFVNFWATWCRPCLQEMPSIDSAQKIIGTDKAVFILASEESWEEIENFRKDHPYQLNFLQGKNFEELNLTGLPTTFIFSPEGKLVYSEIGYKDWSAPQNIQLIQQASTKQ